MKKLIILNALIASLTVSATALGAAGNPQDRSEPVRTSIPAPQSDAEVLLAELDQVMIRVKAGDLGSMSDEELAELESARKRIRSLLEGQVNIADLAPEQRIEVYNNQELMVAIIRGRPFEQKVCKSFVPIGSRIPSHECVRSERRQARTRDARETTELLLRWGIQ